LTSLPVEQAHNLFDFCCGCWQRALERGLILTGDLWNTPTGLILGDYHQLPRDTKESRVGCWLTPSGSTHEDAYAYWSTVKDQGLARREGKNPYRAVEGILLDSPLPLWLLFELDTVFEIVAPTGATVSEDETEFMFNPEITLLRLTASLDILTQHLNPPAERRQQWLTVFTELCQ
jgi:hypothetical protein